MVIFRRAFLPKVYIPFTLPILLLPAWMCSCKVSFCLYLLVSVSLTELNADTRYEEREEETGQPTRPAVPDGCIWGTASSGALEERCLVQGAGRAGEHGHVAQSAVQECVTVHKGAWCVQVLDPWSCSSIQAVG